MTSSGGSFPVQILHPGQSAVCQIHLLHVGFGGEGGLRGPKMMVEVYSVCENKIMPPRLLCKIPLATKVRWFQW